MKNRNVKKIGCKDLMIHRTYILIDKLRWVMASLHHIISCCADLSWRTSWKYF